VNSKIRAKVSSYKSANLLDQNYCKTFSDCYDCFSKPYCGWCPDQCVLSDFSLISNPNNTINTCHHNSKIQNSKSSCPIGKPDIFLSLAPILQLNVPFRHTIYYLSESADFDIYIDFPVYGISSCIKK
jgi:hypothetical protein